MHCSKNMDKLPLGKDELAENGRMGIGRKCRRVVSSQQDLSLGDEAIVGEINWGGGVLCRTWSRQKNDVIRH